MAMTLLLFIGAIALLAALMMSVSMVVLELDHRASLGDLHVDVLALLGLRAEGLLDLRNLILLEGLREGDFEYDEEVAELVRGLVVGHTVVLYGLDLVGLDDFARLVLYSDLASIKMSQDKVYTSQGLEQGYLLFHQEVSSTALEGIVLLLLDLNNDVARLNIRVFISLSVEDILLTVGSALVNLNLKDFLILDDLLAIASLALVFFIDDLTFALAIVAWTSALRVHARSKHLHDSPHAAALASTARSDCTGLTTEALALVADSVTVDGDFGRLAVVKIG